MAANQWWIKCTTIRLEQPPKDIKTKPWNHEEIRP